MESTLARILRNLVAGILTVEETEQAIETYFSEQYDSASLRDKFAMEVMKLIITDDVKEAKYYSFNCADVAYQMADAMLAERSK